MGRTDTGDGGEPFNGKSMSSQVRFERLFVDITGVEEIVDRQDSTPSKRYLDTDTASIGRAVTAVAKNDGLTDTIDEPEGNHRD